jgi:hypothetical protein
MTTAQLRNQAWEAFEAREHKKAAMLFRKAIAVYPAPYIKGSMSGIDIDKMESMAKSCESIAAEQYREKVAALVNEGMSTSDAQGIVDLEEMP